ncbi:MAG: type II toxin-antitoxin system RelE/ParE family toxin [Deltaproteobacteria bacterium]|nr:MAG: type II toxin-antitoxin system RelE/ParE family toxin [Deltaproteobacteria bacterium]
MKTILREIREYLTEQDHSPFGDWLDTLKDRKARAAIRIRLDRLRLGNFGDCEPVGEGVYELRIHFGPGYRIYLGQDGDILILLLRGGTKKSQSGDIRKAKAYWRNYKRRKNE